MKTLSVAAIACTGLLAFGASACEVPPMNASIPDGATASRDTMVSAYNTVKKYNAAMQSYLACVDGQLTAVGKDATDEFTGIMNKRHNDIVDEMQAVAGAFNKQLEAYNAAHKAASK